MAPPIPIRAASPTAASYRTVPVDTNDPRFSEPLVDLAGLGLRVSAHYARADGDNPPYGVPIPGAPERLLARRSVAMALLEVQARLARSGFDLLVLDAYRPISTQEGLWAFYSAQVRAAEPGLPPAEVDARTAVFVSDPRRFDPADETTWPVHITGGAVDVTLVDRSTGALTDMGAAFDEFSPRAATDYLERDVLAGRLPPGDERVVARRVLYAGMVGAGFTNYPHEFWHYDLGTQLHVLMRRLDAPDAAPRAAWFGPADPEPAA